MDSPSIYASIVFDLHPKIKDYIDNLNATGQIDLDDNGYPYIISSERNGSNIITKILRNGKPETFILNSRKKVAPITSWKEDGYVRPVAKQIVAISTDTNKERMRRVDQSILENIINNIMR